MMARPVLVALVASLIAMAASSPAQAAPGDLDPGFGQDGKVTTNFRDSSYEAVGGMATQSDEKIVAVGEAENQFAVARYGRSGLDRRFGANGRVVTSFGGDVADGNDVAIQLDGKIVVAGEAGSLSNSDFAVARFNPNGSLDPTFGGDGRVTTEIGGEDAGYTVALQPDGRIVVAGPTAPGTFTNFGMARYMPDGSLDPTWGSDGIVTLSLSRGHDFPHAVAIQPDGKILVFGDAQVLPTSALALVRYQPDGSLDPAFGDGGIVLTDVESWDESGRGLALQPDGRIVVTGGISKPARLVARYTAEGSLDATFGSGGIVTISFHFRDGFDLGIQQDGKIVTVGAAQPGGSTVFGVSRHLPDGSLDQSFGDVGLVTTSFGRGASSATSVEILRHGLIVVGGVAPRRDSEQVFGLARYLGR